MVCGPLQSVRLRTVRGVEGYFTGYFTGYCTHMGREHVERGDQYQNRYASSVMLL